jgi:hypothetical protein
VKGKFLQSQPKGILGSPELFRQKSWWQSSCFVIRMRRRQTPQSYKPELRGQFFKENAKCERC